MTGALYEKTKISASQKWGKWVVAILPASFFLLLFKDPALASHATLQGLRLCAVAVIPSLFPSAVLSGVIAGSGGLFRLPPSVTLPFRRLLGLTHAGVCLLFLCLLCGFPVGANGVATAVKRGWISREEGERMLLFCNLPSPAFCIGTVGAVFWKSRAVGMALYGVALVSALLIGTRLRPKRCKTETPALPLRENPSFFALITASLRSATQAMLSVTGCVVFFTFIAEVIRRYLFAAKLPAWICLVADYLLEISGGASKGAVSDVSFALPLCAFGIGWSGLSVHCQILSVCEAQGLKPRGYLRWKLLQGILAAALMGGLTFFIS